MDIRASRENETARFIYVRRRILSDLKAELVGLFHCFGNMACVEHNFFGHAADINTCAAVSVGFNDCYFSSIRCGPLRCDDSRWIGVEV